MATAESKLPAWTDAQENAVTHATAAAEADDPAEREQHLQLAQVWATIALSHATMEQTHQLDLSLRSLSGVIDDLPSRMPPLR